MKKIIIIQLLLFMTVGIIAQNFCLTPAMTNNENESILTKRNSKQINRSSHSCYHLKVYFHVIRMSNGTGGQSLTNVQTAFDILNSDFNTHGIFFLWDGMVDYIDNSVCYSSPSNSIFVVNNHDDGIDIYLYGDNSGANGGLANGIGSSSEFYVSGNYFGQPLANTHVVSHEMGHVLFLWHTHHGTFNEGGTDNPCAEYVNGSNSSVCGDYVEDTPADPNLNQNVNPVTFVWNGSGFDANNDPYNPDVRLIMSYTHPYCMTYFSAGQGERMRNAIESLAYLQNTIIEPQITGKNVICNSATYSVENISDDISVVWELANSYYANSSDLFKPNYPTTGKCTIVRDSSVVLNDTLVAKLYYNGTLFKTLKKAVKTMTTFTCQLENEGCSGIVPGYATSGNRVEVPTNCKIRLVSDKLKHMTVSHLGATPTYWQVNQAAGTVTFQLPLSLSYQAIVINGHSTEDCSNFSITFYNGIPPDPIVLDDEYSLRVTKLGTNLTVMLQSVGGIITPFSQGELNAIGDDFQWTLRINNVSTGLQVYNQPVTGSTKVVSTSGWASGYYIVQAIVGGDVVATMTINL